MTLLARLDKSGTRVLCGVVGACRGELARVENVPRGTTCDAKPVGVDFSAPPSRTPHVRAVWFGPGWDMRADGTWALTERAKRELRRLQTQGAGATGRLLGVRKVPDERHDTGGVHGWLPWDLPADAVCPLCASRQTLDPAALRVTANDRGGRPEPKTPCIRSGCPNPAIDGSIGCADHPVPTFPYRTRPAAELGIWYELPRQAIYP